MSCVRNGILWLSRMASSVRLCESTGMAGLNLGFCLDGGANNNN